jgi:hypothetical protein
MKIMRDGFCLICLKNETGPGFEKMGAVLGKVAKLFQDPRLADGFVPLRSPSH